MISKRAIREIERLSWFLGSWLTSACKMAVYGIRDYTAKQDVCGFLDAHMHLCRVDTQNQEYLPQGIILNEIVEYPLIVKQDYVGVLHDGKAYSEHSLAERMKIQLQRSIRIGTREIWGVVDTTPDINSRALNIALSLKDKYKRKVSLQVGCYSVFGLKNPLINGDRLRTMEQAAQKSDFITCLPEKDQGDDRIGFKGNVALHLELAYETQKPLHIHADQMNSACQCDSLQIIECLAGLTPKKLEWFTAPGFPRIFLVHVISPSCYAPAKFSDLVEKFLHYNIGVICCPTAGVSDRPLRSEMVPNHNSLARIIEMMAMGVRVFFGTDNVNDIFVPSNPGLMPFELYMVSNVVRNYATHVLVKASMGMALSNSDRETLKRSLSEAMDAYAKHAVRMEGEKLKKPLFDY